MSECALSGLLTARLTGRVRACYSAGSARVVAMERVGRER